MYILTYTGGELQGVNPGLVLHGISLFILSVFMVEVSIHTYSITRSFCGPQVSPIYYTDLMILLHIASLKRLLQYFVVPGLLSTYAAIIMIFSATVCIDWNKVYQS